MVFVFLSLTYFTYHNILYVHPCCLKWLDCILFYGYLTFHCTYIHHFFRIHLSIHGHLCCFHILASVNNAAISIEVHIYLFKLVFSYSLGRFPIAELMDHIVFLLLFIYLFLKRLHAVFNSACTS